MAIVGYDQQQAIGLSWGKNVTDTVSRDVTVAVTRDVTEAVTANVSANMSRELDVRFAAAEARLAEQARLHIDAVRQESRLAAEGYGATMDSIELRLDRIERKVTVNHRDTVRILAEHHERISVLESGRASAT